MTREECLELRRLNANGEQIKVTMTSSSGVVGELDMWTSDRPQWKTQVKAPTEDVAKAIKKWCDSVPLINAVDWTWLFAISGTESGWVTSNYSGCNDCCCGLMGLAKAYFQSWVPGGNILDIDDNAHGGVVVFNGNYNYVKSKNYFTDPKELLMGVIISYNAGIGGLDEIVRCTKDYCNNVVTIANIRRTLRDHRVSSSSVSYLNSSSKHIEIFEYPAKVTSCHNYIIEEWLPKHQT